jgi:serine/threonine-protein kinase
MEAGAMAAVYQARDRRTGRRVAVKMAPSGPECGAADRARIRREATVLRALRHPSVVRALDLGEHQGRPFFTMEWLPGGSLADRLGQGALAQRAVVGLGEALGCALDYLHGHRIVHLDLRPSNTLFTRANRPRLIDFGLAKRLNRPHGSARAGGPAGDPRYLAPEETEGRAKRIGPAADIHALGAILYEALTGQSPFQRLCLRERLRRKRLPLVPPSALRDRLPPALDQICLRCLQREPEQRYATAASLADDLRRARAGQIG